MATTTLQADPRRAFSDGPQRRLAEAWTAAVINFNGGGLLSETVASIKQMEDRPDELIVVDDGSTDESLQILRRRHPDVRVVVIQHTGRPNAVRNVALEASRHRYVLLSDNDIRFAADALRHLMRALRRVADAAVCTPLIVSDEDEAEIVAGSRPLHFLCWSTAVEPRSAHEVRNQGLRKGIGGGIQLVDTERVLPVGTFDEDLTFGWSDGDLHLRLQIAGLFCYVVPAALAFHRRERTAPRSYGQFHNRWYIMLKSYQLRTLILVAPALFVFELMLMVYALRSGAARTYLRAHRDTFSELGEIRRKRREVQNSRKVPDRDLLSAADLDVPRYLHGKSKLMAALRLVSSGFRGYWNMVRRLI